MPNIKLTPRIGATIIVVFALAGASALYASRNTGHTYTGSNNPPAQSQTTTPPKTNTSTTATQNSSGAASGSSVTAAPVYHLGDQQCINGMCITPTSTKRIPAEDASGSAIFVVDVTVTGTLNGNPANSCDLVNGSQVFTSTSQFVGTDTVPGQLMGACNSSGGIEFGIPSNVLVGSYLYGNLTWEF